MNRSKHVKRNRGTRHDTGNRKPRRGPVPIDVLTLLLAFVALPAPAGTTAALVPAVGDLPDGVVLDGIPEFLGPLYRVDETSVPGLVVLVTVPIARDRENWYAIVNTCATDEEDVVPDMDACADAHPELLDNRDWTYFSLWRVADRRMELLAVSREGRMMGEPTAGRLFLSSLAESPHFLDEWRGTLLQLIALLEGPDLDEIYEEVLEYSHLSEDAAVQHAWMAARYHLLSNSPCSSRTSDLVRCGHCCDVERDACNDGCAGFGLRVGLVGCVGAAIGCALTEAGAPLAWKCCTTVGGLLGSGATAGCNVTCRWAWNDCWDECEDLFGK